MARPKGQPKLGGRKKGTKNKLPKAREIIQLDAIEALKKIGHEPILKHVAIFRESIRTYNAKMKARNTVGAATCLDVALKANADIMKYVYPARKAVEHTGPGGEPLFKTLTDMIVELEGEDESDEDDGV